MHACSQDLLRTGYGPPPDVARAADAAMLAISRGGLRIGEVTKALWRHYEQVSHSGIDSAAARLFVRPSAFGNNKTPGAYRQVPLMALMTAQEAAEFEAYLAYRRSLSPKGPLFGVLQPDGTVAPFHSRTLGAVIADCLRRVTGLADATAHALRRAAANGVFLAIHEARMPATRLGPFLDRLTGWAKEDRARVAETVAPRRQSRDRWHALARLLGHGGPGTTFGAYITLADLAVFEACAMIPEGPDRTPEILEKLPRRLVVLSPGLGKTAGGRRAEIRGEINSPAQALLQVLQRTDDGSPVDAAAHSVYLPVEFVEERLPAARAWSALRTTRGRLRLQPEERFGKLAPAPLNTAAKLAEAVSLADGLIALAATRPEATARWIATTLHDATEGNSGTRLQTPGMLREWCATAVLLRPPPRWLIDRVAPLEVSPNDMVAWSGARPAETRAALRKSRTARSITVRCRLLTPEPVPAGTPSASWAGCVRFAAHLAAIHLDILPGNPLY